MASLMFRPVPIDSWPELPELLLEFDYDRYGHNLLPSFRSVSINRTTRRMRAQWTPELAQDLEIYHRNGVDVEAELTAILNQEINNSLQYE